ncbi:hypothetical protein PR202_gb05845 [Eleusine coracana subsp. coracana]|uniref:DCD domain-containing protein n=1 Tax=Eleusine coracana subsp. coracana TaxID=191504 RepID=A0AAV5E7A7_ELECO|nr:hypothetical protein PR202_gb05845 [Eleusine coracana subsp. coracana]
MESYDREFWQFSDQLRLQTAGLSALSLGDSIWSPADQTVARLFGASPNDAVFSSAVKSNNNFNDPTSGPGLIGSGKLAFGASKTDRYNNNNNNNNNLPAAADKSNNFNTNFNSAIYGKNNNNNSSSFGLNKMGTYSYNNSSSNANNNSGEVKSYFNKSAGRPVSNNSHHVGSHKKGSAGEYGGGKKKQGNKNDNNNGAAAADKRFKTLPASEALPRGEPVGGTAVEVQGSVRAIRPGLPLFLYNYSTHQLHGIFEAASFGGTNIDPTAWEDKKCPGESRFPAQVRVATRKIYEPLEEDAFRPILHHYDGPKFRLELSVTEALALLDIFADKDDA